MDKHILVISPTPSHPQTAGNRARIYSLLLSLQKLDFKVTFVHIEMETGDRNAMQSCWQEHYIPLSYRRPKNNWRRRLRRFGKMLGSDFAYYYHLDEWYDSDVNKKLQAIQKQTRYDAVIVEYVFMSKALENFGADTIKIIDTHDVFTDRHKKYLAKSKKPSWLSLSRKSESLGLNRADIIIAIQTIEKQFYQTITNKKVITIGHVTPLYPPSNVTQEPQRILFIGSNNLINKQAVEFFVDNVWPLVIEKYNAVEFAIAGRVCNSITADENILLLGELDDLKPAYESATIIINPIQFGTGLKIKTIEALGHAKPLITTSIGAEGLENGAGNAFLVADNAEDFATHAVDLLNNHDKAHYLSERAHDYAIEWNRQCLVELNKLFSE